MFLINSQNVLDLLIKSIRTLPCRYQNTALSVSKHCRVAIKTLPVSVVFTTNKILFFGVWFRNDLFDRQPCRIHHHALSVMHYYVLCSYLQYENSLNLYSFKHIWNTWWRKLMIIIIIVILKRVNWKKTEWRLIKYYVSLRPRSGTAIKAGGAEFTHFSYFFLLNPLTTNVPII